MPELPEVEVQRRALVRWMKGRTVVGAEAEKTRTFRGSTAQSFRSLRGKLESADRKGKYLLLAFEKDQGLLAHLGMTGKFLRRKSGEAVPHSRARLLLDDGTVVHYRDPRLFGRLEPARAQELWQLSSVKALGIDPLAETLTPKKLKDAVGSSKQDLKVALTDQSRIAGLGNIHAAEALFRAGLHPARKPASLDDSGWKKLSSGIRATIRYALDHENGDEIVYVEEPGSENPFLIYGRAGEKCRRCKTTVQSFTQAGRTTHFCPKCQPKRKARP